METILRPINLFRIFLLAYLSINFANCQCFDYSSCMEMCGESKPLPLPSRPPPPPIAVYPAYYPGGQTWMPGNSMFGPRPPPKMLPIVAGSHGGNKMQGFVLFGKKSKGVATNKQGSSFGIANTKQFGLADDVLVKTKSHH